MEHGSDIGSANSEEEKKTDLEPSTHNGRNPGGTLILIIQQQQKLIRR